MLLGSERDYDVRMNLWAYFRYKPAIPELHLASRSLAVDPCPSHTTALRFAGEKTGADERLGERGPLGEGSAHSPGWWIIVKIIVNTWKSQCHCNSVCIIINASAVVLYCIAVARRGWEGWCIGGLCGRWVVRRSSVFVAMGLWHVSYFCFLTLAGFTAISRPCCASSLLHCSNTWWVGWIASWASPTTFCGTAISGYG